MTLEYVKGRLDEKPKVGVLDKRKEGVYRWAMRMIPNFNKIFPPWSDQLSDHIQWSRYSSIIKVQFDRRGVEHFLGTNHGNGTGKIKMKATLYCVTSNVSAWGETRIHYGWRRI